MSKKSKGINAERDLVHRFWADGWACVRVSGSGNMQFPLPDLLAGNSLRRVAIECKTTKGNTKYFSDEELDNLNKFASLFGAEAWLAVKFDRRGWRFVKAADAKKTPSMRSVSFEKRGITTLVFSEFISLVD